MLFNINKQSKLQLRQLQATISYPSKVIIFITILKEGQEGEAC